MEVISKVKKLSEITDNEFYKEGGIIIIEKCIQELILLCIKHRLNFVYEPHCTYHYDKIKVEFKKDVWIHSQINQFFYWRSACNEMPIDELINKINKEYE